MVVSDSNVKEGKKVLDSTVGGLVWVQRRNGTWWPGQIIGSDELPENSSSSPRSGTPIKLLGRDDLNVGWYDLKTTKVIKAFRCGEYDSTIKKAKVAAPKLLKKSLRYPRKEIAILHALEIEKHRLIENGFERIDNYECSIQETSIELTTSACKFYSNNTRKFSYSCTTPEEINDSICLKGRRNKGKRRRNPNDSDDDGSEGVKRMKYLDELGVCSNQKIKSPALANHVGAGCNVSLDTTRATNDKTMDRVAKFKRKRSQVVYLNEPLKRKCPQRPSAKVLQDAAIIPVQTICDKLTNGFETSNVMSPYDCEDGKKLKDIELSSKYLPNVNSSNKHYDVSVINEKQETSGLSVVWKSSSLLKPRIGVLEGNSGNNFHGQDSYVQHEAFDEHDPAYYKTYVSQNLEKGSFKWQSKGKGIENYLSNNGNLMIYPSSNGSINKFTDLRKNFPMSSSSQISFSLQQPHFGSNLPSLYDVEVTVEPTRFKACVPYISIVSKVSGKSIMGHPVIVEALEDTLCDIQTKDYLHYGSDELDEDKEEDFVFELKKQKSECVKLRPHYSCRKGKSSKFKKSCGSSLKKTRKLSSLIGPQKVNPDKGNLMVHNSMGPTLACVPLKLVFSRLNEALNGSKRPSHHVAPLKNNKGK